jgi:hypothetical protein
MENESSEAKAFVIAFCKPKDKDKVKAFEQKLKQHDLYFDFWIIAKWAINKGLKQTEIIEHKKNDFKAVEDFKNDVILRNRIDRMKSKAKGFSIKQSKPKPIVTAYSPYDPDDTERERGEISVLIDEMMFRLDQAGLSNHHTASNIVSEFIGVFFPHEYPYSSETIRSNYLRFLRNSNKQ